MVDSMFYRECQKGMYVGLHKACLPLYSMFKLAEDNIGEDEVTVIVKDKPNKLEMYIKHYELGGIRVEHINHNAGKPNSMTDMEYRVIIRPMGFSSYLKRFYGVPAEKIIEYVNEKRRAEANVKTKKKMDEIKSNLLPGLSFRKALTVKGNANPKN